jgi:hypothetical protein
MRKRGEEVAVSDCCSPNEKRAAPTVMACPVNGARSKQVDLLTVRSLARHLPPGMPDARYYFCEAPDCDVVYFPSNRQAPVFRRSDLWVRVGVKERDDPIVVCYCFGFTRQEILDEICDTGCSSVAERITAEVKAGNCACEVKNPSGKCCLGNLSRIVQEGFRELRKEGTGVGGKS